MFSTESLAIVCLYVQGRKAIPWFPGTDRCSPSPWVHVTLNSVSPYRESDRSKFPVEIKWDLWEILVPLIESQDLSPLLPVNQNLTNPRDFQQLVRLMTSRVEQLLREAGRLPNE